MVENSVFWIRNAASNPLMFDHLKWNSSKIRLKRENEILACLFEDQHQIVVSTSSNESSIR